MPANKRRNGAGSRRSFDTTAGILLLVILFGLPALFGIGRWGGYGGMMGNYGGMHGFMFSPFGW